VEHKGEAGTPRLFLSYPVYFQYYGHPVRASLLPGAYRMPKQYRLDVHISTELIDSARKAAHAGDALLEVLKGDPDVR
jgi:hypothetical protein